MRDGEQNTVLTNQARTLSFQAQKISLYVVNKSKDDSDSIKYTRN